MTHWDKTTRNVLISAALAATIVGLTRKYWVIKQGVKTTGVIVSTRGTKGGVMVRFRYMAGGKTCFSEDSYGEFIYNKGDTLDITYLEGEPKGFLVVEPRSKQ